MANQPTPRLGRPPAAARHAVALLEHRYASASQALRDLSLSELHRITGASPATLKRLRQRVRAGKELVPEQAEVDQNARIRRHQRNLRDRRVSKAKTQFLRDLFARKANERREGRIIDRPILYRRTATSPTTGPFAVWYRDDPSLPYSREDQAALAVQHAWLRNCPEARASAASTSNPTPDATPFETLERAAANLRRVLDEQAANADPSRRPAWLLAPSHSPFVPNPIATAPVYLPATQPPPVQAAFTVPTPPSTPRRVPLPPVVSTDLRWPRASSPAASFEHKLPYDPESPYRPRNHGRRGRPWTTFGKDLVNQSLPDNDKLRAWVVQTSRALRDEELVAITDALAAHASTIAFAHHPPDKTRSCNHFHVLSTAANVDEIFKCYGSGDCVAIYRNSTPYHYLRYMLEGSDAELLWGPAAPPELVEAYDAFTEAALRRHRTSTLRPVRPWRLAGYENINTLLASLQPLDQWRARFRAVIDPDKLRAWLHAVHRWTTVAVSILQPPSRACPHYTLLLLAQRDSETDDLCEALGAERVEYNCTPYNLLSLWDREAFAPYPDFAIHFGPQTHWTLRECNHPQAGDGVFEATPRQDENNIPRNATAGHGGIRR